jgi:hypothetical protein
MPHRIMINAPEFARLVAGRTLDFRIGSQHIELSLERTVGARAMILAIFDALEQRPPLADPPQAREFLPNRFTRRPATDE